MDNNSSSPITPNTTPGMPQQPTQATSSLMNPEAPVTPPATTPSGLGGISTVTPPVPPPSNGEGGSKMVFWLIGGVVAIVLIVGGIYLYLSNQQASQPEEVTQVQATPIPTATPEPTIEEDLDAIDVSEVDDQFQDVDNDLQNL